VTDEVRREAGGGSRFARNAPFLVVLGVLAFVAFVRVRVSDVPLERDEGEYAYAGQLILHGVPPYQLAYNMKFPGTYYAYSLILAALGPTPAAIHLGLLLVNAASTLLVFLIGRRLLGEFAAAVAAVGFALLSADRWILGVFAHATHFILLPALGGLLLLLRAQASNRRLSYLGAGALLGLAMLMKQHAVFFLAFGLALVLWDHLRREPRDLYVTFQRAGLVVLGGAIPLVLLIVLFAAQGVVGVFWLWTFQYAKEYVSQITWSDALSAFLLTYGQVTLATLPLWLFAGLGVVALWVGRWTADVRFFLSAFLAASFVAICPGFFFREHYFILLLPSVALFLGVAALSLERLSKPVLGPRAARVVSAALFGLLAASYVVRERTYLFSMSPSELSRTRYGVNPFIAAIEIARYIRSHTSPDERVAVLGSEPEIYFYADRRSATGYLYTYPLMEHQRYARAMQNEMIHEIEAAHPKYLVYAVIMTSWLVLPGSDMAIFTWIDNYTKQCYELVGIAEIDSLGKVHYAWGTETAGDKQISENHIYTFRRNSDAPCIAGG
jgi:hypothetical protein